MNVPGLVMLACCSKDFFQIPVGTIGLSDYLARRGVANMVLHSHLQSGEELRSTLLEKIADGWHISLVLHWKENVETFYRLAHWLRGVTKPGQLSCGGITAGFFFREILLDPLLPDLVFRGDPDFPVLSFCEGRSPDEIPNVAGLRDGAPVVNPMTYLTSDDDFEAARFTDYSRLQNADAYLKKANALFLHVPISRGCWAECSYCGGSGAAYRRFSSRPGTALRSVAAVLRDVEHLFSILPREAGTLHLHFDDFHRNYIPVVRALAESEAAGRIRLYITERGFLSAERLLADAVALGRMDRVTFEVSPETENDAMRAILTRKSGKARYDEKAVRALVAAAATAGVHLWVYYSLFNNLDSPQTLSARIDFLDRLQIDFARFPDAHLIIHSLALDCASDAYMAVGNPPGLADYRRDSGRFSTLLGNLTLADTVEARLDLMTCKFFIEIMRNPETYLELRSSVRPEYASVRRIVAANGWQTQAFATAFDSYDFVATILEELDQETHE